MDLQHICQQVQETAKKAGQFIREERQKITVEDIELKGKASLVTYVDKNAEQMIVKDLKQILPDAGFVTEEETVQDNGAKLKWVIDPLDGTTNFIHGITPHSVSIALIDGEQPLIGVIYEVGLDEMFYAWKDGGAFLNDKSISVSKSNNHSDVLLATGYPYYDFEKLAEYMNVLRFFMIETRGMRRMGSAAIDLAYVACGRFDGFFEHALHAWDVAAGILLVQEAGGKVSDFKGENDFLFGKEIVASNSNYYPDFFEVINKQLG